MEEYTEEYKEILKFVRMFNEDKSEKEQQELAEERYKMFLIIKKDIPCFGEEREETVREKVKTINRKKSKKSKK